MFNKGDPGFGVDSFKTNGESPISVDLEYVYYGDNLCEMCFWNIASLIEYGDVFLR